MTEVHDGWYWHLEEGEEPEVVHVQDGRGFRAGSDIMVGLPGSPPGEFMHALNGRLVGPLEPPSREVD